MQRPNLVGDPALPADQRDRRALVQHRGVCDRTAIHHRDRLAQPGARARRTATWISRSMRRVPIDREPVDRGPRGNLQPVEHSQPRRAGRRGGRGELRHDHDRPRSARRAAGCQIRLLDAAIIVLIRHELCALCGGPRDGVRRGRRRAVAPARGRRGIGPAVGPACPGRPLRARRIAPGDADVRVVREFLRADSERRALRSVPVRRRRLSAAPGGGGPDRTGHAPTVRDRTPRAVREHAVGA